MEIMSDVLIIGGGVSGISCGLIIGSAIEKELFAIGKTVTIIDSGHSDAKKAIFNNMIGFPIDISGEEVLENAMKQIQKYDSITFLNYRVIAIKEVSNHFEIECNSGKVYKSRIIVIATGFKGYYIDGLGVKTIQHSKTLKSGRVQIDNDNLKLKDNVWVCGNLSGMSNQFAIAAGSGAQVGVNIISEWAGEWKVIHDKIGDK
jgi:predicted flavoprotein YhiN